MTKNDQIVTSAVLDGALGRQTKRILTEVGGIINDFAFQVDQRFNKIEADIAELNRKYDHLITTLDKFLKRLDDIEADNSARDAQLARLDRWIHQIADKTGVELKT
ncbi:hypothetical protein COU91_00280 [Candidatus Saccharibacteria bacterium CG10_big_fil_rev_8_21_14_0_10_47_8]|nr:MAG: hypothetical protein COU91_00280 [Candidatus Saccharibacteria bacterium CG10_big_fil_rev_8_21_14_0_10_47_8]